MNTFGNETTSLVLAQISVKDNKQQLLLTAFLYYDN